MRISFQPIFYVIGIVLIALGVLMIAPAILDAFNGSSSWEAFAESCSITLFFGFLFVFANRPGSKMELTLRETFLLTTSGWIALTLFASLPFLLTHLTSNSTDSFFETVSCLTTTGATVITGLDFAPKGLLLWRALLEWFGGIGIIVVAMTILPVLSIGGMQLFRSEFSGQSEKIKPRFSQITKAMFWTYAGFTALCAFLLWLSGMDFFDAICHSMSALATGGLSNYDTSIAHFNSPEIEIIITIFMLLGAMTILMLYRFISGEFKIFWQDDQIRTLLLITIFVVVGMTLWRWIFMDVDFLTALRYDLFNYVSAITTTGFTSTDYQTWGIFPMTIFLAFMFIGGCTGSTAGGLKIMRLRVAYQLTKTQLYKLYRPHVVRVPTYNEQEITPSLYISVVTFLTLFFLTYGILVSLLSLTGLDFLTCVSGAGSALCNFGPGFGPLIGPSGNYSILPTSAKWIMMAAMILGRLELITVIVIFRPSFWKK